jgi:hypothetical protein
MPPNPDGIFILLTIKKGILNFVQSNFTKFTTAESLNNPDIKTAAMIHPF